MITNQKARDLAYEWHSGQWSRLYSFASSGLIGSIQELNLLKDEIKDMVEEEMGAVFDDMPSRIHELGQLLQFVCSKRVEDRRSSTGVVYFVAPWAGK